MSQNFKKPTTFMQAYLKKSLNFQNPLLLSFKQAHSNQKFRKMPHSGIKLETYGYGYI